MVQRGTPDTETIEAAIANELSLHEPMRGLSNTTGRRSIASTDRQLKVRAPVTEAVRSAKLLNIS